jgi:cytosine/uracil/thiamine/allantoin permease
MRKTKGRACNYNLMQTKLISFLSQYIQLLVAPIGSTLASFVGIAVTSAGASLYGQVLRDPLKLIDHWDNRACAFFTSLTFVLSTLAANISANSLHAGNQLAAVYPRYINIRRGQVICAFLGGWALCPWKILARWGPSPERYISSHEAEALLRAWFILRFKWNFRKA